ncbi:MAG: baseplate J/gp47 family protein [Lachnospiraceae bacterium]|nr:baseplate J/gp47 family protein [Lachnospiraceae bacterium]
MAELSFIETDSQKLYNTVITTLEKSVGEPLYPGDERRIFGDAFVAVVLAIYSRANDACKQKMLRYARGEVLDALGERYACYRIPANSAMTTLRFSINSAITTNIIIPEGTRATPDNEVYFKTMETVVLQAGAVYVDAPAECTLTGETYNGYLTGSINRLVDLVPFIDSVENITVTFDGNDGEPYPEEDGGIGDEHYRERIRLAPTSLSVAGPRDAYEYHAKSADASIADVAIISDVQKISKTLNVQNGYAYLGGRGYDAASVDIEGAEQGIDYHVVYEEEILKIVVAQDGVLTQRSQIDISVKRDMAGIVLIVPILYGGKIPGDDIIQKVYAKCNAEDVRPMTDLVIVQPPTAVQYDISIKYYTTAEEESECIKTIEGKNGAIDQYREWQGTKMGRAINPDKLRSFCLSPKDGTGCTRIEVISPEYKELINTQIASFNTLTVSHAIERN